MNVLQTLQRQFLRRQEYFAKRRKTSEWQGGSPLRSHAVLRHARLRRKLALLFVAAALACGVCWWWMGPERWEGDVPPAAPYTAPVDGAVPTLLRVGQLPPLPGYESPKPVIAADALGRVVVLAQGMTNDPLGSDLLAWRSSDGGRSWDIPENRTNEATRGETYFDPWLEADRRGRFYAVYSHASDGRPQILRSRDGGETWSTPLPIPWKSADRPVLGISPDGRRLVVAAAMSERREDAPTHSLLGNDPHLLEKIASRYRHSAGLFVSADHGGSWEKCSDPFAEGEHAIPFAAVAGDGERLAASWIVKDAATGSRSVVCTSTDRGRTWTTSTLVESLQPDRPNPFNGARFPVVAVDGRGSLQVAYVASGATSLLVSRSQDWRSWQSSTSLSSAAAQEIRMAAIDAIGPMVHVTWVERVDDVWQAFYRGSRDFGASWSEPCCLSKAIALRDSSVQNGFKLWASDDQTCVTDDGSGRVHAVWCIDGGGVIHATVEWAMPPVSAEPSDARNSNDR